MICDWVQSKACLRKGIGRMVWCWGGFGAEANGPEETHKFWHRGVSSFVIHVLRSTMHFPYLVHVPEVFVLSVRQVIEGMGHPRIDLPRCPAILLIVFTLQVPTEGDDCEDKQTITSHVDCKSNQIARCVPSQKHLRTCID